MPSDAELILGYKEQLLLARAVGIEKGNLDRKLDSDSWDRICRVTGLTKSTAQSRLTTENKWLRATKEAMYAASDDRSIAIRPRIMDSDATPVLSESRTMIVIPPPAAPQRRLPPRPELALPSRNDHLAPSVRQSRSNSIASNMSEMVDMQSMQARPPPEIYYIEDDDEEDLGHPGREKTSRGSSMSSSTRSDRTKSSQGSFASSSGNSRRIKTETPSLGLLSSVQHGRVDKSSRHLRRSKSWLSESIE